MSFSESMKAGGSQGDDAEGYAWDLRDRGGGEEKLPEVLPPASREKRPSGRSSSGEDPGVGGGRGVILLSGRACRTVQLVAGEDVENFLLKVVWSWVRTEMTDRGFNWSMKERGRGSKGSELAERNLQV